MHTVFLTAFGINTDRLSGVLDNSPHKIGRHLYGSKLYCSSLDATMAAGEPVTIIMNGGCYNQEIEPMSNVKFI